MRNVLFIAPVFNANTASYIAGIAAVPDVRVSVISEEPIDRLPGHVHSAIHGYERIANGLDARLVADASRRIAANLGPIHRMIAAAEGAQVAVAEAREMLSIPGMSAEVAKNFRDKSRMKEVLRNAGLPVAASRLVSSMQEAHAFAAEVGYPLVVKPQEGVASKATSRVHNAHELEAAVRESASFGGNQRALLEEMIVGDEFSYDTFKHNGNVVFHSVSRYYPTPLEVVENPWIQWVVVLPRELESQEFDEIRSLGSKALEVLGLDTGMSHMEWFRRKRDGRVFLSEVAARPPGAQIVTLISRAHDIDCMGIWANLMLNDSINPIPGRRYASGGAYLRGQGQGRVRAVHGLDVIERELGHLVTDARLPAIGQEKATSYEGEGFILVRHPETRVVEEALRRIISTVRVELG